MKVACLLAAGLALASSAAVVRASQDPTTNDVQALNYALQLEHLENQFYIKGLSQFNNAAFQSANIPTGVRDYISLIQAHEQAHVSILTGALTTSVANGGYGQPSAGSACSNYSFTNTNFPDLATFLSTAITLEDVGVSAYVAALNHLTNTNVQQVAATIATIEARHAAFLRNAVGSSSASPATNAPWESGVNTAPSINQARLPAEVLPLAAPFLVTCSYNLSANVPNVRPGGVALSSGSTVANAQPSSAFPSNPAPTYTQKQFTDDMGVLQYALTLEYLEADFYQTFANRFTASQFAAVSTIGSNSGSSIASNVDMIRAHEVAHVAALQNILASHGQTPVQPGCYNWSTITDATTFLTVADALENTGVSAYDGAANLITDTYLQQIAAAVAVVEARHAAYLNNLNGKQATNQNYMSGNLDQPLNQTQILSAVGQALAAYLPAGAQNINNCANNKANTGSAASLAFFSSSSSSSGGNNNNGGSSATNSGSSSSSTGNGGNGGNGGGNGSASFAVPAFATAILAFASALLF